MQRLASFETDTHIKLTSTQNFLNGQTATKTKICSCPYLCDVLLKYTCSSIVKYRFYCGSLTYEIVSQLLLAFVIKILSCFQMGLACFLRRKIISNILRPIYVYKTLGKGKVVTKNNNFLRYFRKILFCIIQPASLIFS